jgi:hypothetical protein
MKQSPGQKWFLRSQTSKIKGSVLEWGLVKKFKNAWKVCNLIEWSINKRNSSIKLCQIHPTIYILTNKMSENAIEFICCRNSSWSVSHDFTSLQWLRKSSASYIRSCAYDTYTWAFLYFFVIIILCVRCLPMNDLLKPILEIYPK